MSARFPNATLVWVCTDCMLANNGYDERELGHTFDREPWSALVDERHEITQGRLVHDDWCEYGDGSQDCTCEHDDFSRARCGGCGSQLAGERHAYTLWTD